MPLRVGAPQEAGAPGNPQLDWTEGRLPLLRLVGQIGGAYLIAEGPDGLYLIDQHAAHERVLFEKMSRLLTGNGPGQINWPTMGKRYV